MTEFLSEMGVCDHRPGECLRSAQIMCRDRTSPLVTARSTEGFNVKNCHTPVDCKGCHQIAHFVKNGIPAGWELQRRNAPSNAKIKIQPNPDVTSPNNNKLSVCM